MITLTTPRTAPESAPPPRKKRAWPFVSLILLAGIAGAGFYAYDRYQKKMAAREAFRWNPIVMPERMARVPAIWSAATLASRLQKAGKIRDASAFSEAAEAMNLQKIVPGGYLLPKSAGPRDLVKIFRAGPTHQQVTFPEGFTGWQIAARLEKNGFAGARELEKVVYPVGKPSPFEGTLFPETYLLPIRANGKTLVANLQKQFAQNLEKLPKPLPKVNGKPISKSDLVILASLVEREAAGRKEMPAVAAVLINRLNEPMRLQVDASIIYARLLDKKGHKTRLFYEDLRVDSPYNTYKNDGLPPTPICNPGKAALLATARPAKISALFYVYSSKAKRSLFADNYRDHMRNVNRVRAERRALEATSN